MLSGFGGELSVGALLVCSFVFAFKAIFSVPAAADGCAKV